jgi:hypothetical protein
MTTNIARNRAGSITIRRYVSRAMLVVVAVTYSAIASTNATSTIDHTTPAGEMEVAVHWHGNTPHYHVVAAGEQNALNQQLNQSSGFRAPNVAYTTGTHRALVINLVRPDGLAAPRDVVNARYLEGVAGMNAMSRGMLTIQVDLFGRDVAVPYGADICDQTSAFTQPVLNEVRRELSTDGYRFISFVLPVRQSDRCGFGGLGQVNGTLTWNAAFLDWSPEYQPTASVVMHEWGHNLGLWHSNYLQCSVGGQPVALAARADRAAGACKRHEYGGEWSVMGSAFGSSITAGERRHLGWLRDGEQATVSQTTVTLGFDGPVSLVWLQNAEGDLFQVEFVKPGHTRWTRDYFSNKYMQNAGNPGVLVKFVETASTSDTDYVLDTTPQTGILADAPLKALQSWSDATGSVSVTVLSITENSATVQLNGLAVAPSAVNVTRVAPRADIGTVDLEWEAASSALRVARYEVIVYEGAEQRQVHVVTADGLRNALQIPNATRGSDYWVAVRAINELGVAGPTSAVAPVRWENPNKPGNDNGGTKPCTGKRPGKRCK